MIEKIIAACLRERRIVFFAMALLALWGGMAWKNLPVEAYPDLGAVSVQISTQSPGLAAEEVEQQITVPLERQLSATPGLVSGRSSSTFGLSLINLIFKDGMDVYAARQRVTEQLAQVNLPAGVTASMGPVTSPSGEIYRYTLESDRKNLMQLSEVQNWFVIPALQKIQGVADVTNFGGFTREYELRLDPHALYRFHIGINTVLDAIRNSSINAGGGRVTRGEQSYIVRGVGMIHTLDEMGDIPVTQHDGVPVFLRELGRLQLGHQVREGILGKNSNPDTIEGIVSMVSGENASHVLALLHTRVQELQKQLDPQGIRIVPYLDRDNLVSATTEKVTHTVLEGVGLVFVILILFLGSPRSAIVAAVTIPLALAFVFVVMGLLNMPANLFSLGAIDFGVIVDGAIVVTEAILCLREARPDHTMTLQDVQGLTGHVGRAIVFATLIIIVAYSPLFAFVGAEGRLFRPMAYTVSFALLGALLCAIVLTPSLAFIAMRKPHRIFHNKPLEKLHCWFRAGLAHSMKRPAIAYCSALSAFGLVVVLGMYTGREFLPDMDEGALWLQVQLPSGLSLQKASDMADEVRKAVMSFSEPSYVVTQLGRNDSGTDAWTPSHIEVPIGLKPYSAWPKGETKAQFISKLRDKLNTIPGIEFGISQPIADGMNDQAGGAHSALVLRVYGHDLRELRNIGKQIVAVLKQVPGTKEASIFQEPEIPQLNITANRRAAARYGISVSDIMTLVGSTIGGSAVSQIYIADRTYDVTVQIPHADVSNLRSLGHLPLMADNGALVPLEMVASIALKTGEGTISHEMTQRQITLRVDNGKRPLSEYMADAQARIAGQVHFDPSFYRLEWAGEFEQAQRAASRLVVAVAIMLAIMLVLLFGEFRKFRQAALVLAVVPLALLGGLVALQLRGETLNVATAVGFIALFGVAVQNGIIMVSNINRHRREGATLYNAVLDGAGERFRPVLMTATVASAGMLPAAVATGIGTDVQRGLATVVVGGLGIATLLTLFILPTFYYKLEAWYEKRAPENEPVA
ncbi:efflux RND transporter permease subunit [Acetobacter thailandicus]|uniref:efflux RND transporter permease subunit n=1 Tax=Acetobacter thailandicus TaxID=1502842 RepID=UPI001BA7F5D2|nr:CusA/CzcA family heavy metal efflux RND transporter [Acetobacter thailandicus]MBS0960707.1 efflux RND transporter permease subunit [Acetobacter thailandicus]